MPVNRTTNSTLNRTTNGTGPTTGAARRRRVARLCLASGLMGAAALMPRIAVAQDAAAGPNLDALRWYAREGEPVRMRAELARLRAAHPGWVPPANPLAEGDEVADELWAMFAAGDMAGLRARLAALSESEGYVPPPELAVAVERRETLQRARNAHRIGAWETLLKLANEQPEAVATDLELTWFVALAYARTERMDEAREALGHATALAGAGLLPVEGTAHAAIEALGSEAVPLLEDWARTLAPPLAERVAHVVTRLRLAEAGVERPEVFRDDAPSIARRFGAPEPVVGRVVEFARLARAEAARGGDRELMGWWHYRARRYGAALGWFEASGEGAWTASRGDGARRLGPLEGRVRSLIALDRAHEALALIERGLDGEAKGDAKGDARADVGLDALLLEVRLTLLDALPTAAGDMIAEVARAAVAARSATAAEALGWYAHRHAEWRSAAAWFGRALSWHDATRMPTDGRDVHRVEAAPEGTLFDPDAPEGAAPGPLAGSSGQGLATRDPALPWVDLGASHGGMHDATSTWRVAGAVVPMPDAWEGRAARGSSTASSTVRPGARDATWARLVVSAGSGAIAPSIARGHGVRIGAGRWRGPGSAAVGLALSLREMGDRDGYRATLARYGHLPRVAALGVAPVRTTAALGATPRRTVKRAKSSVKGSVKGSVKAKALAKPKPRTATAKAGSGDDALRARIHAAHRARRHGECLSLWAQLKKPTGEDHATRGWCLMEAGRPAEADRAFGRAIAAGTRGDADYGRSLARFARGATDGAHEASAGTRKAEQRATLTVELLTQRARAAFDAGDYAAALHALDRRRAHAAEPRDLGLLRGWAHHHRGERAMATAQFERLDAQLSTSDTRSALRAARRQGNQ